MLLKHYYAMNTLFYLQIDKNLQNKFRTNKYYIKRKKRMLVKGFATSKLGILCIDHSWHQTSLHLGRNDVIWTSFETQQKYK